MAINANTIISGVRKAFTAVGVETVTIIEQGEYSPDTGEIEEGVRITGQAFDYDERRPKGSATGDGTETPSVQQHTRSMILLTPTPAHLDESKTYRVLIGASEYRIDATEVVPKSNNRVFLLTLRRG